MNTPAGYLLDTSVVSVPAMIAPDPEVVRKIEMHGAECAIAAPVWHELVFGCRRLPKGKRRSALEEYVHEVVGKTFRILPYDERAAAWHGSERARLEAAGKPAPFVDGQIAAIAVTLGLTLVTLNIRDFRQFQGLQIETWSKRPHKS